MTTENRRFDLIAVFPGQGSQSIGMLADLAQTFPRVQATFADASDVLGYDLWDLVQNGDKTKLNQTEYTQPAMLVAGVAVWNVWRSLNGVMPIAMAGHSLGEYTALVCAGALPFEQAVALVAERAHCMQQAVPEGVGAMAAILGLDDDKVRQVCADMAQDEVVEAVNFNAPGQVVIAGNTAAVERAMIAMKEAGAKRALPLPVSVPSHCALMQEAAQRFSDAVNKVDMVQPMVPIIQNVDAAQHTSPDEIRALLIEQLYKPVRWVDTIQSMANNGVNKLIEAGPGKVLTGLNKRIDKAMLAMPVLDSASLNQALEKLGEQA
ncbi:MAG: ACP S-malonyltransferase [Gammaproteobacteria bacterium]|nr:ACP S-malonyltransferase [Gammaproteobacteria bacterium]